MKKSLSRGISIALLSLLFVTGAQQQGRAQDVSVSYQTFYDNLAPYGQWVQDNQYGNVWVPNEGGDFRPYGSRGHWVMTDYGNTWVSEDPWGWACYHYGRWTYDNYYGWVWVPGYEWAPAWVSWRYGGGYSGWAPLGPGISVGVSYNCPESWWVFVQPQYMYANDCYSHWRGPSYNNGYLRQTTIVNNYYMDNGTHVRYNYGPHADVIQRDTHQPVQVYRVSQMHRPGAPVVQNNRVSLYRPAVNRATANTARPANVMQAPRQIGRPQAATNVSASRQPEFRQQVQRQPQGQPQNTTGNRGNTAQPQQGGRTQGQPQQATGNRGNTAQPQQGRNQSQPNVGNRTNIAQPQQGRTQPQNTGVAGPRGNNAQPQQGRTQPQPQRAQPQAQPQPQRAQPQPQPQRMQPQAQPQQNRPEPQRMQAQPQQSRPEPQRMQPQMQQPQSRPQPMQQAPRQEAPRQEAPRMEGGGGGRR